jgi:putative colanic acid biosynthesis acetyltransferase WcaF
MNVNLSIFNNTQYETGGNKILKIFWFYINAFFFNSFIFHSCKIKIFLLKLFNANLGECIVIKPRTNIKYPWNISIGDYSWIGEDVWLDSLVPILIQSNVCISQGAYICTGSHDWSDPGFGLIVKSIVIEDGAWIGAKAVILPGVTIGSHSVVCAGAVVSQNTEPYMIYAGNPAVKIKQRVIK